MKKFGISSICEIEDLCTKSDSIMRRVCRIITMCVLLLLTANHAAEGGNRRIISEKITIYYRFDSADINPDYRSNKEQIETFRNILLDPRKIDSISIHSLASPDGSSTYNLKLAQKRGENVSRFISDELKAVGKIAAISTNTHPQENWQGLADLVSSSYTRHDKTRVLNIINDTSIGSETRKWRLQQLDGGYTWDYICRHYMPQLRTSTWICVWAEALEPLEKETMMMAQAVAAAPVQLAERTPLPPDARSDRRTILALKTNMLYDAVTALNYSVEVPLGHDLSLQLQQYTPWWLTKSNRQCLQFLSLGAEFRWWFKSDETLQGHFIGAHAWSGKGDMQWNRTGCWQFEFWSAGVSYGYSMPIGRWANLEFSISAGYASIPYRHYIPTDDWEILIKDNNKAGTLHYFGPTKAEVSLVIPIRVKAGKGGAR